MASAAPAPIKTVLNTVRSQEARDSLVLEWMSYATTIANRISKTLPRCVDPNDIRSESHLLLIKAAQDWDERWSFKGYLYRKINWGIQDYLRTLDMLPRNVRAALKKSGNDCQTVVHISDVKAESWYAYSGPSPLHLAILSEVPPFISKTALTKAQASVIQGYYFQEMTVDAISKVLGVSPTRIWQLRASALKKLRNSLAHHDPSTAAL